MRDPDHSPSSYDEVEGTWVELGDDGDAPAVHEVVDAPGRLWGQASSDGWGYDDAE